MSRFDAALEAGGKNNSLRANISALPTAVRERLSARGLEGTIRVAFEEPAPTGAEMISRSHPIPSTLAEMLLEGALDPTVGSVPSLGRAGAWRQQPSARSRRSPSLRLRYKLIVHSRRERMLLAEEAAAVAWTAGEENGLITGDNA